jgi:hypothetical protein
MVRMKPPLVPEQPIPVLAEVVSAAVVVRFSAGGRGVRGCMSMGPTGPVGPPREAQL